jgi:hypothetical protein
MITTWAAEYVAIKTDSRSGLRRICHEMIGASAAPMLHLGLGNHPAEDPREGAEGDL